MKGAIVALLLGKTGITSLVGTRVYTDPWPQGAAYPLIGVASVVESSEHHSGGSAGISGGTWDITCAAATDYTAKLVAEQVRLAIDTATGTSWGSFAVHECVLESCITLPVTHEGTGKQTALHRVVLSFSIRRSEAAANP